MKKQSRRKWLWPAIIGGAVLVIILWFAGSYNGLVSTDETVSQAWGNIQAQYQRRADLIPNLVATVQGAADFEQDTVIAVTQARTQWQNAQGGPVADQMGAARGLDSAISRLLLVMENYPDLKATQNFLALQDQLEGTENRIAVARKDYNAVVKNYNVRVRRFPTNIVAGMFGFTTKEPFEAITPGAETVPTVGFE